MIFCIGDGRFASSGKGYQKNNQVFNVQVTPDEFNEIKNKLPVIKLNLTESSFESAWKKWWGNASKEDKDAILSIPHFNADIFKEITGIEVEKDSLVGKKATVEIEGKKYNVTIESEE